LNYECGIWNVEILKDGDIEILKDGKMEILKY
jgi:hypothetical protein